MKTITTNLLPNAGLDGPQQVPITSKLERALENVIFALKSAGQNIANELATRRAISELQSLSDDMLKDIGLNRGLIEMAVREKLDEAYSSKRK